MLPVFRHPRCINCHGGVNPLTEQHRGFDQLDLSIDRMSSPENRKEWEAQCQQCHTELEGWTTPGEPVFFVGKDDETLCKQMKKFEKTGDLFVEHILNDHKGIQFIAAGFKGDRALGEDGLKDFSLVAEPPRAAKRTSPQRRKNGRMISRSTIRIHPNAGASCPRSSSRFTISSIRISRRTPLQGSLGRQVRGEPPAYGRGQARRLQGRLLPRSQGSR